MKYIFLLTLASVLYIVYVHAQMVSVNQKADIIVGESDFEKFRDSLK